MEQKQLDFNQPLLSVRRFSSTASTTTTKEADYKRKADNNVAGKIPPLPVYKSELKSGPVRNPGAVPFVWERSPGRPKDERKQPAREAVERPPIGPKLPPGRVLNAKQQASGNDSQGTRASWSQMRNGISNSQNVALEESSKDEREETSSSSSGSESGDEAYVDALDTLSRSESFFLNCSISGVSGLDGPDMKPSGAFMTDPQSRDFMMGRFLPAAKAMASETPQCSTWKQPVAQELPRQITKAKTLERRPLNRYRANNIPNYVQADELEDSSEDEDLDSERPDGPSLKFCGLLPQISLQNSLCLLNPVSGMRKQGRVPIASVRTTKCRSSVAASCNGIAEMDEKSARYEQRSTENLQKTGIHENGIELRSEPSKTLIKTEYEKLDESSVRKRLQGPSNGQFFQSVHERQKCIEIPDKFENYGASGFRQCAKGSKIFRELLDNERKEWESVSASPVVEKTVYIDSVHMVKPHSSNSTPSGMKGLSDYMRNGGVERLLKSREIEETGSADSSPTDFKHLEAVVEEAKLRPHSLESFDSSFLSLSDKSIHDVQMDVMVGCRTEEDIMQVSTSPRLGIVGKFDTGSPLDKKSDMLESSYGIDQDSIKLASGEVADDGKINFESQLCRKLSEEESSHGCYSQLLPPPLPKSPSESWLMRTLPIVSSRNTLSRPSVGMNIYPKVQASKTDSLDPKWETMVRTSNVQHGHLRFSAELLPPIPET